MWHIHLGGEREKPELTNLYYIIHNVITIEIQRMDFTQVPLSFSKASI